MVVSREYNAIRNHLYTRENKDQINKRKRERYQRDREHILKQHKRYREANKLKRIAQRYALQHKFIDDKCAMCKATDRLNFHHIDYVDYKNPDCGITLCVDCHKKDHRTVIISNVN